MHIVQVFHGTAPVTNANAIARKGPDFTRIGGTHGASLGQGFYTSDRVSLAWGYAKGTGSICVCKALQGNIKFHPDSVCVSYILNLGPDTSMAEQLAVAKEKLDKEYDEQEMVREAQLEVCHSGLLLPCTTAESCMLW